MDRGAWQATVHRVANSWTQLSTHTCTFYRVKLSFLPWRSKLSIRLYLRLKQLSKQQQQQQQPLKEIFNSSQKDSLSAAIKYLTYSGYLISSPDIFPSFPLILHFQSLKYLAQVSFLFHGRRPPSPVSSLSLSHLENLFTTCSPHLSCCFTTGLVFSTCFSNPLMYIFTFSSFMFDFEGKDFI